MASSSETTGGLKTAVAAQASPGAVRPRFRERQLLRAADLEAQQAYLIAARRRHYIGQHGWGIVYGLDVQATRELLVQPGMAVDGYGRELIVTGPVRIPRDVFTELNDTVLDVWLIYKLAEVRVSQRGSWSCGPGKNTRTGAQSSVRLTAAANTAQRLPIETPRAPVEVPAADVPFLPHRTSPDDPALEWPVYLGTIKLDGETITFVPESPHPFATLTGELVTAPSGRARMQVGTELQSDTRRFAVRVADGSGKWIERIGIDREGRTYITGNTTVTNSLSTPTPRLLRLRLGPARLLNFRRLAATPAAAAPWQVYRTSVKEDKTTVQQLRFEIQHPGDKGDPTVNRFAVGTRDAAGLFSACFSVSADCTLTIEGDVTVGGQLVEGPIQADASDPRFGALVAQNWVQGTKVGEIVATTGTIFGTITNSDGGVIANAAVALSDGVTTTNTSTDTAGRYSAPLLQIGTYDISASALGFTPKTVNATLAAADLLEVSIELSRIPPPPPPARIQGRVSFGAAPIINARVEFRHEVTGELSDVVTDTSGNFSSALLPPGTYEVRVSAPGFFTKIVKATPGETLTITLETEIG
jgi:hypothetical protein